MRMIPVAAGAALVMLTVTASAGVPTTPSQLGALAPGAIGNAVARQPAINPLTKGDISSIEGTSVYGSDDGKLGQVSTVLIDPQTKKIDRLVVTAGGDLGRGGHRVAIPIDQFTWDADKGAFRLSTTIASLKPMPEWVEGDATASGASQPPRNEKPSTGGGDL
jgi:sporulation protein YlmC with PRC-barrel domain